MTWLLNLLIVAVTWQTPMADVSRRSVDVGPPEGCSHAKTAIARAASEVKALRLKSTDDPLAEQTDVLHYRLDFEVVPSTRFLGGSNTMTVRCREDGVTAFRFWLQSGMSITSVRVDGSNAQWSRLDSATLEVELEGRCDEDEIFELEVVYEGFPVSTGLASIVFETQGEWPVVSTLSEPWFSYTWWPVKEDSRDKATGEMLVTVPDELTVVSNGVLIDVDALSGHRRRFHWSTDYPMSPYLFAFSATHYMTFDDTFIFDQGSMPVEFFIYPESDTAANRNGWLDSVDMLATFGDLYGLYPFIDEKYAIYQFPWGGGMEHQTATGQGGRSAFSESLTAHELAHQWWGDMVTCATWSDIWLNEGFAMYSEALWFEHRSGTPDQAALHQAMFFRRPDEFDDTVYVYDTSDVRRIFSGNYSYRKGSWVVHMLRGVVGDGTFFAILDAYREQFEYLAADTEDLRAVAEDVSGRDLSWFFDRWVYRGGAPAYSYGWQELEIDGQPYLEISLEQTQDESPFTMPVTVETLELGQSRSYTIWNDARMQHFLIPVSAAVDDLDLDPDDWILTRSVMASAFQDGPPKVVAVSPGPGSVFRVGHPLEITVTFHQDVVIDGPYITLHRIGGGQYDLAVIYDAETFTATVTSRQPLAGGSYELVVSDDIVDVANGLALDGEMTGPLKTTALPSGDGVPGGDAVIKFGAGGSRRPSSRVQPTQ